MNSIPERNQNQNFWLQQMNLKTVVFVLLLVFLASVLAYKIDLPNADDLARHIKNGELILHGHFDILFKNIYSFTLPNQPFVNHHWLFGVVFYLLNLLIGWSGLVIIKILVFLAAFTILFKTALKKADFWLVAFFAVPTIITLAERSALRPEMFSYLFLAIFLYILTEFESHPQSRKIYWLIPIQVLWVNTHLFFPVGIALVGGFLFEKILLNRNNYKHNPGIKKLAVVFGFLVLACLVNPNFINGATYPLRIFNNYGMDVAENHSPLSFFRSAPILDNITTLAFLPSAIVLSLSFIPGFRYKKRPVYYLLGSIATIIGGLLIVRFLTLFAFIFLPAVAANLNEPFERLKTYLKKTPDLEFFVSRALGGLFILVLALLIITNKPFHTRHGLGLTQHSNDPAKFMRDNHITGPVFNDYDSGSYLIYNFYPQLKVFVDNRPEAYSADFFKNTYIPMIQDDRVWQQMMRKYQFNVIFFARYDAGTGVGTFLFNRVADPDWDLVYADGESVIFIRNIPANNNIIKKYQITGDNVRERMEYLRTSASFEDKVAAGDNYNLVGRQDLGMEQFFDVVSKWPDAGKIWMVMGEWEINNKDSQGPLVAALCLNNAINNGYKTAEAYSYLGSAYIQLRKYGLAKAALDKALRLDPNRQDAKDLLEQMNKLLSTAQ